MFNGTVKTIESTGDIVRYMTKHPSRVFHQRMMTEGMMKESAEMFAWDCKELIQEKKYPLKVYVSNNSNAYSNYYVVITSDLYKIIEI